MIESIEFKNFKVLKDAKLPLGPFTLIVGANGSGKSTALQALDALRYPDKYHHNRLASVDGGDSPVQLTAQWGRDHSNVSLCRTWGSTGTRTEQWKGPTQIANSLFVAFLSRIRLFALNPGLMPEPAPLRPQIELGREGENLAVVLDQLRDSNPERFEALNQELGNILPEFDHVLFDTPSPGNRSIKLRTRIGHHRISATDLSQGTLAALAIITLAYLPEPPTVIGIEEPERGIHPRLLRHVRDALYRLSYPDSFNEDRKPVQVIATTQSPYFLDEFSDHPEEIVVAEKVGLEAKFKRLMDHPHMAEILEGTSSLGEVWYTGVLGGVPARS